MVWMSDEQYLLMQDTKEKKITARSARHTKTHCGKGGAVKFPSDYMSKKELKAMSSECKTYRMNEPMTWAEFKEMPDDLKIDYIKALRKKFNVPNKALAEMFDVSAPVITNYFKCLGLSMGSAAAASLRTWNKEGFLAWAHGASENSVEESQDEVEETDILEDDTTNETADEVINEEVHELVVETVIDENTTNVPTICTTHYMPVIPKNGTLTFEHNDADDALATIKCLLSNVKVNITVSWECVE